MNRKISLPKLQDDVYSALKLWHEAGTEISPLNYLYLFQQARLKSGGNAHQATNQLLFEALETMAIEYPTEAGLLRKRFLDGQVMYTVANWLNVGESTAYRKQQEAIERLALILQNQETQARAEYRARLEKRLKLPLAVELIGVETHLDTLVEVLTLPTPPWLISIEGLGGIGKTALANALVRQPDLSARFYDIAWVSAKQQELLPGIGLAQIDRPTLTTEALIDALLEQFNDSLPLTLSVSQKKEALVKILKQAPRLIVIDNLETASDYQTFLPFLVTLVNPSKFLLTSRHSLCAYPDIFCHSLAELSQADTIHLIRYEARMRGIPMLANAPTDKLRSIYDVVGGNPLALKLVIGQISILPLSQVLDNLKQARGPKNDELYTYIYWQTWNMLTVTGQQVLLTMPLAQEGTLEQLLALNELEPDELSRALEQLAALSLVQIGGGLEERRYSIHRLTETFLLNEAIQWNTSV
ncbi:MAG: hypothetical protein JW953_22150 [Anaerolineae bacterium]|nr:hypothetical protein [Anaerolineae bacterium]